MGEITKVNYPKLAEIYSNKGKHGAIEYLKSIGVKAPASAINRMKNKYVYDEELKKYIVPEEHKPSSIRPKIDLPIVDKSEGDFMSMEELCDQGTTSVTELNDIYIMPFPQKSREAFEAEMFLDTLTEYAKYLKLDKNGRVCHINKSALLKQGFEVIMY